MKFICFHLRYIYIYLRQWETGNDKISLKVIKILNLNTDICNFTVFSFSNYILKSPSITRCKTVKTAYLRYIFFCCFNLWVHISILYLTTINCRIKRNHTQECQNLPEVSTAFTRKRPQAVYRCDIDWSDDKYVFK